MKNLKNIKVVEINMYLYVVISKDTSLQPSLHSIICIRKTVKSARKEMKPCRTLYQFDMTTQKFAKVLD